LFDAVVAGGTKALEIVGVEEQRLIAFMWPDGVTYRGRRGILLLQAVVAKWMRGQLRPTSALPACGLIELTVSSCCRAALIAGHLASQDWGNSRLLVIDVVC